MNNLYYEQTEFTHEKLVTVNGHTYLLVGTFDDYNENTESYELYAHDTWGTPYEIGKIEPIENGAYESVGVFFELENHETYFNPTKSLETNIHVIIDNHKRQLEMARQSNEWKGFTKYLSDIGIEL